MEQVHECWAYLNSGSNYNSKKDHHHQQIYKESTSMNSSSTIATWEEKAFAEDAAGHGPLGGCIWPPRSYSCSFCMREFRSAQALGGHMNVHRRDRARLKQCQLIKSNHLPLSRAHQQSVFLSPPPPPPPPPHDHDHQKLANKIIKMREDGDDDSLWLRAGNHPDDDDDELYNVETDLCVGLNISVASSRTRDEGGFCGDDEDGSSIMSCKRPKTTSSTTSISSFPFFIQSEDNNLDLELRLGDPPKVK